VSDTFFGHIDWQHELKVIDKEVQEMKALPNGTTFRVQQRKRIFLIGDGAIHEFYDRETMQKYGHKDEDQDPQAIQLLHELYYWPLDWRVDIVS